MLEENKLDDMAIGKMYNVHRNTINNINRCCNWTNIHNYKNNIRDEFAFIHYHRNSKAGSGSHSAKITEA